MLRLYDSNAIAAEQRYQGEYVELDGRVKYISDEYIEVIPAASDMFQQSGAKCIYRSAQKSKIIGLRERDLQQGQYGTQVTIRGTLEGLG